MNVTGPPLARQGASASYGKNLAGQGAFMEIHLEKIDAARNCYRFYEISLEPDLFAQTALVVRWGRIGGRGRIRIAGSGTMREAQDLATRILRLRLRHGYALR